MINREELLKLSKEEIIDILFPIINEMAETIKRQAEKIAELEARLNQNSQNSSKPPSSDMFNKPKPKSLRKRSGRKPGGQRGHEGHGLELPKEMDEVVKIDARTCCGCEHDLHGIEGETIDSRYKIDIPPIRTVTIRYDRTKITCPNCGAKNEGIYPDGISSTLQYGENIKALTRD